MNFFRNVSGRALRVLAVAAVAWAAFSVTGCAPSCDEACKNVAELGGLDQGCRSKCKRLDYGSKERRCIAEAKTLKQVRVCEPKEPGLDESFDKLMKTFGSADPNRKPEPSYTVTGAEVDGTLDDIGLRVFMDAAYMHDIESYCGKPALGDSLKLEFLVDKTSHRAKGVTVTGAKTEEHADCVKERFEGKDMVEGYGRARVTIGVKMM